MANPIGNLQKVGSAKLEMYFFDIYYSELYSANGKYQPGQYPLALQIRYLRDIEAIDLIEKTAEEWQKLGFSRDKTAPWLVQLDTLWPDIKKHDVLTLVVNNGGSSEFYFNDKSIGKVEDTEFGAHFLDIWLDENASYPKLRKKLIGEK
ncbi:chalcone isomerase family protein [Aliiglaciecola litoralis]